MPNWSQIILMLLMTVPTIVAKVEAANPNTPGADKKLKVMDEIQTALVAAEPLVGSFLAQNGEVMAVFSVVVDASVDLFNRTAAVLSSSPAAPQAKLLTGVPNQAQTLTGAGLAPTASNAAIGAKVPPTTIPPAVTKT